MASLEQPNRRARAAAARVILDCIRGNGDFGATAEREASLWKLITQMAAEHGVLPLVYRRLAAGREIPADAITPLRRQYYGNAVRNQALTRELVTIVRQLNRAGIAVIVFKGPVLALQAWNDRALRQFSDLDLLVHPTDVMITTRILAQAGYQPRRLGQDPRMLARMVEDEFMRPGSGHIIDLHWEMNPPWFAYGPPAAAVWAAAEPYVVDGVEVLTPARWQLPLLLAVHGAKHGWCTLSAVVDFASSLRIAQGVAADSPNRGDSDCDRMLLVGAALARDLVGCELPAPMTDALAANPIINRLAQTIERRLLTTVGVRPRLYLDWLVPLRTIASWRGRLGYLMGRGLTPTLEDLTAVRLPPALYPLYYGLRPLRLAWAHGRRLIADAPPPVKRVEAMNARGAIHKAPRNRPRSAAE